MRKNVLATLAVALLVGCGGSTADEIPADQQDTSTTTDDTSTGGDDTTPGTDTGGGGDDTSVPPTDGDMDTGTPPGDTSAPPDAACTAPKVTCGTACADLTSDTNHCGVCNRRCLPGQACITAGGATACACPTGSIICGTGTAAVCANTQTDVNNCGACGTRCATGETCDAGACKCKTGVTTMCGGRCTDLQTDTNNCGTCGLRCPTYATCSAGSCKCPTDATNVCGTFGGGLGQCTDTGEDPNNCGGCGNNCGNSQMCNGTGMCVCRAGLTSCTIGGGTTCADTKSNPRACGACGTSCTGSQVCEAGACKTGTTCSAGLTRCSSGFGGGTTLYGCANTQTDPLNCGGCGNQCQEDQVCVAGNCRDYRPAFGCTTCPCAGCAVTSACCPKLAAGASSPICVAGGVCP